MIQIKLTPEQADTLAYWLEYAQSAISTNLEDEFYIAESKADLRNEHKRIISIKKKLYEKIL